jgi:hypothetical protein
MTAIMDLTKQALIAVSGQDVIERVTVTRGYAELSKMYPDSSIYRAQLTDSLMKLADMMEKRWPAMAWQFVQLACRQTLSQPAA